MTDRTLVGGEKTVSLNMDQTMGVMLLDGLTNNQTRSTVFNPSLLVEWAEAVEEAYGNRAEIVFTPGGPMVATKFGEEYDPEIGIGVADIEVNE